MLFRLDNPRFIMNAQEFPANVVFYCLAYQECAGDLIVNYTDPGSSRRVTEPITPTRSLPIFPGMNLHEYVVPFFNLHDNLGRRGATIGFNFVARSSFRVAGANYGIRTLDTTMIFPVIGGGIIRIQAGGQEWDIANPTFDPHAEVPGMNTSYGTGSGTDYVSGPQGIENRRVPDDIMINAYQRSHRGYVGNADEIERRRAARLANFDLREVSAIEQQQEAQTPPPQTERRITLSAAEVRQQERLAQIQAAEARQVGGLTPTPAVGGHSRIFGAPLEEREVSLVMPVSRAPKAPPKTRLERISEDNEDD
jgi:hypothetical protein